MSEPYKGWTVLELLGHRRLHGLVQETTLAGAGMLRIDVYEGPAETPALTQYYPPSSVYCLTPATEEACRKAAMPWAPPALAQPREEGKCTKCGAGFPTGCCNCEAGDDCNLCGDCCDQEMLGDYCDDCDSPCEGGECDPPHLCRRHAACPKCNK